MHALIENGQVKHYPYTVTDIRRAHPEVTFGNNPPDSVLAEFGMMRVFFTTQPEPGASQIVEEGTPTFNTEAGRWEQVWIVREKTAEEVAEERARILNECVTQTQQRLDAWAQERNYDGILSLCTYATSSVPKFAIEGQRGVDNRDATWAKLYEMMAEVEAGTRPKPAGFADIEPELPVLSWPA
jgi:hypothetical protein